MKIKESVPKEKTGKMSKRIKLLLIAAAVVLVAALVVCIVVMYGSGNLTKARESYLYSYNQIGACDDQVDSHMTVDGKLDEEIWSGINFTSHTKYKLTYQVGTYFTDNGLYIGLKATDEKIVWNAPYDFNKNTGFEIYVAGTDAVNDPYGGNVELTANHATELFSFFIDSQNVKPTPTTQVYAASSSTETELSCELFIAWEQLKMEQRPEQVRIWTLCRHIDAQTGEGSYVYNGGFYTSPSAYFGMHLFDEQGSISQSGTLKNTADMTLGNSPLGYGATDRWDLSGDNSGAQIRTANSNGSFHQVVYLKEAASKNFEFETTVTFLEDGESRERKAGIVLSDSEENRRLLITDPNTTNFRLGTLIHGMYWVNTGGTVASGAGSSDGSVSLKVISYNDYLYYFYRYPGETDYTFAYCEKYDPLAGDALTVGLYASSKVTFSDWHYQSYDQEPAALRDALSEYVYFAAAEYAENQGSVTISATALKKGDSLTLTAVPSAGYYLDKVLLGDRDITDAFTANAVEGSYTFTPTSDANLQVSFAPFTQEQRADLRRSYVILSLGQDSVVSGAAVSAYPVTVRGDGYVLNDKSSVYYYTATTSSAGYATFELPYAGSRLYAEGTYLVKISNNAYFHYEAVITVTPMAEGEQKILEIPVSIPADMTIQGSEDVEWTIDDDRTVTVNPSRVGDHYSIAYFPEPLVNGEISAEFTTSCTGGVFAGFGYRIASGDNVGNVGIIGVAYGGSSMEAVTYNYYGSYGGVSEPLNKAGRDYNTLLAKGDIVKNADGSVTFKLRLIRGETSLFLYVGDTHVYTFTYGSGVQINAATEVQLGLMVRSSWSFDEGTNRLYTVRKLQAPAIWDKTDRQATVSGTVSGDSRDNMTVLLKGTNIFGITQQQEISVPVNSEGRYSFTVGDLGENASGYTLEFYQGNNVLRTVDGKAITLSLKAKEAVTYDVEFNEFKAEYETVIKLEGVSNTVTRNEAAIVGSRVTVPEAYTYGSTMYVLDKTAQDNVLSGTVAADGSLQLSGTYKIGFAYSTNTRFEAGADENGLTLTSPTTANDKYILSKESGNAFELTATFTGIEGATELGSGFLVSDGTNHISFMWMGWSGGLQARDHWSVLYRYQGFGSAPAKYDPVTNSQITMKMAYSNRTFRFYQVEGEKETLISVFSLDQYSNFDTGGWTADTALKVGFFSWNNVVSAVEVSDIQLQWLEVVGYDKELYLPNGQLVETQKLVGEIGSEVSVNSVYDLDGSLYIVDGTAPEDVATGTLKKGEHLVLSGTLNNKAFEYGTSTDNIAFQVSKNNNLLLDMDGGMDMYLYSAYMGSRFDIKARFTSTSENGEVGFSVMDAKGNKLTFRLVAWKEYLAIIPDYDWSRTTFLDVGAGQVTKGETVTLAMSYDNGTFTFTCNGKVTTYTNEDFEDELYVGFLSYNDSLSGAEVELLDFNMPYPKPKA